MGELEPFSWEKKRREVGGIVLSNMVVISQIRINKITMKVMLLLLLCLAAPLAEAQCAPGQFNDGSGSGCQSCPINFFNSDGLGTACDPCSNCTNCVSTSGVCTNCFQGETPSAQTCSPCPSNTFSPGYLPCQSCSSSCASCSASNGACTSCSSGFELSSGSCNPCQSGFFSSGGTSACQPCPNCSACSSSTGECSACDPGFELTTATCTTCSSGTFSLGGTASCQPCDNSCQVC